MNDNEEKFDEYTSARRCVQELNNIHKALDDKINGLLTEINELHLANADSATESKSVGSLTVEIVQGRGQLLEPGQQNILSVAIEPHFALGENATNVQETAALPWDNENLNPVWNEKFQFDPILSREALVKITLRNENVGEDLTLGVVFPIESLMQEPMDKWCPLVDTEMDDDDDEPLHVPTTIEEIVEDQVVELNDKLAQEAINDIANSSFVDDAASTTAVDGSETNKNEEVVLPDDETNLTQLTEDLALSKDEDQEFTHIENVDIQDSHFNDQTISPKVDEVSKEEDENEKVENVEEEEVVAPTKDDDQEEIIEPTKDDDQEEVVAPTKDDDQEEVVALKKDDDDGDDNDDNEEMTTSTTKDEEETEKDNEEVTVSKVIPIQPALHIIATLKLSPIEALAQRVFEHTKQKAQIDVAKREAENKLAIAHMNLQKAQSNVRVTKSGEKPVSSSLTVMRNPPNTEVSFWGRVSKSFASVFTAKNCDLAKNVSMFVASVAIFHYGGENFAL